MLTIASCCIMVSTVAIAQQKTLTAKEAADSS